MRAADSRDSDLTRGLIGLLAALVLLAWLNRFVQDDAFISFRYARNLVEGNGLTFNPGERVEGYTNFLWTLMMAAGIGLGLEPVTWSYVLGLAFFAGSLWLTYRLAAAITASPEAGVLAVLLLGTNFTFSAYATGGLETQSQAFFVIAAVWCSYAATRSSPTSTPSIAVASAAYGAALLTRLDSAVCLLVPGLVTLAAVARERHSPSARLSRIGALVLPGVLLVAPWLLWKVQYYGDVLPNTFYVKVTSAASLARGGHYVYRFFATYWLLPLALLALIARPRRLAAALRGAVPWGATLVAAVSLWCVYVAAVGGDFMEFRFMVPVAPLIMVLAAWGLVAVVDDRRVRLGLVAVLLLGSLLHAFTFWGVRDIETTRGLAVHMEPDGGDWDEVGRLLGRHFDPAEGVVIAVGPAGAIPYYSRLYSVDMRGLVDPWVARNGIVVSTVPGHQRMAPLQYLIDRDVNLLVGHPQVVSRQQDLPRAFPLSSLAQFGLVDASADTVPDAARVLAIPMPGDRRLLVLYLVRHESVERAIAEEGWVTVPLDESVRPF
jgi:arabinofuranosyltransferase